MKVTRRSLLKLPATIGVGYLLHNIPEWYSQVPDHYVATPDTDRSYHLIVEGDTVHFWIETPLGPFHVWTGQWPAIKDSIIAAIERGKDGKEPITK